MNNFLTPRYGSLHSAQAFHKCQRTCRLWVFLSLGLVPIASTADYHHFVAHTMYPSAFPAVQGPGNISAMPITSQAFSKSEKDLSSLHSIDMLATNKNLRQWENTAAPLFLSKRKRRPPCCFKFIREA